MIVVPYQIPIPYQVWGTIRVLDIILYMWGDHMYIRGIIQYLFHITYGGTISHILHVAVDHMYMWGTI